MTTDETIDAIQRAALRTPDVTHCSMDHALYHRIATRGTIDDMRRMNENGGTVFGLPVVINPNINGWQIWAECSDCTLRVSDFGAPINASNRMSEIVTDERGRQRYVCAKCKGKRSVLVVSSE